jgi:hypothetical protein
MKSIANQFLFHAGMAVSVYEESKFAVLSET